jgi:hypothetical protein
LIGAGDLADWEWDDPSEDDPFAGDDPNEDNLFAGDDPGEDALESNK